MIRLPFRAVLLCLCLALPAFGQTVARVETVPEEWAAVSTRAEVVIEAGRASDGMLAALREELADYRALFAEGQEVNAARIDTLREEIADLGPEPEEGATEDAEIAARRAELAERLDELLAPVREAQSAFTAASGLIAELDAVVAARRAEALLARAAPPLNPVTWLPALAAVGTWFQLLGEELAEPFETTSARMVWMTQGVQIGVLFFVAAVLILRSRRWLAHLRDRLAPREAESPAVRLGMLGVGLARTFLPVLGLLAVTRIFTLAGIGGPRAGVVATLLPWLGLTVLASSWLAQAAFPPRPDAPTLLPLAMDRRREGRLHALALGALFAAAILVEGMADSSSALSDGPGRGVLMFVVMALAGLSMLRLGKLLLNAARAAEAEEGGSRGQLLGLIGRAVMLIGAAAPIIAGVGYVNLGMALIWPATMSLALLAALSVVQGAVFDLYSLLTRRGDLARDALAPTLIGFALAIASLPVFAVIWGVQPSTLGEWWVVFLQGFRLGEVRISPETFLTFAVVFAIGYAVVRLLKNVLRTSVLPKTRLDAGGTNAILSGTGYLGITLAALLAITTAGIDLSGLAIVAGALSVGLGFGLQNIVQNFVSGIILLIERPIKIGDWINVAGTEGFVRDISVRSTRIETFDRQDVIVPNADLIAGTVTNYTLANSAGRVVLQVGVAYGTDTRRVEAVLIEIAESHPMVTLNPAPLVTFDGFGADSLNFTVRVVLRDILFKVVVASELNHCIAERFRAEGFEIPFAQRDIWLRNPEALRSTTEAT
jgi:small-conductance mechanosensitive channel